MPCFLLLFKPLSWFSLHEKPALLLVSQEVSQGLASMQLQPCMWLDPHYVTFGKPLIVFGALVEVGASPEQSSSMPLPYAYYTPLLHPLSSMYYYIQVCWFHMMTNVIGKANILSRDN